MGPGLRLGVDTTVLRIVLGRDLRIGNFRSNRTSNRIGGYDSNSNRISNRIRGSFTISQSCSMPIVMCRELCMCSSYSSTATRKVEL